MIRFYCDCGKRLKADDAYAGRQVKCGACGARKMVPAASEAEKAPTAPADGLAALASALRASATSPARAARTAPDKPAARGAAPRAPMAASGASAQPLRSVTQKVRSREPGGNKTVLIGFGAALAMIVIVVILLVVTSGGTPATAQADKVATVPPSAPAPKEPAANKKDDAEPRTAIDLSGMKDVAPEAAAKKEGAPVDTAK
jgi:hypothetical protein